MKAPVVIVVATLTAGILVVGSLLIATGARGEDAVRLACADLPESPSSTGPFRFKDHESDRPIAKETAGSRGGNETFRQARLVTLVAERDQACSSTGAPSPVRS
jgi:hypothetical protein